MAASTRLYITGHKLSPQRALWHFEKLPTQLTTMPRDAVSAKLVCSKFALTTEAVTESQRTGVAIVIQAVSHICPLKPPAENDKSTGEWSWVNGTKDATGKTLRQRYLEELDAYRARKIDPLAAKPGTPAWKAANDLAEKYGYYEYRFTPPVYDLTILRRNAFFLLAPTPVANPFHMVQGDRLGVLHDLNVPFGCSGDPSIFARFELPAGLIRNALASKRETDADGKPKRPLVTVLVKCELAGLLIGMQESDFYLAGKLAEKR